MTPFEFDFTSNEYIGDFMESRPPFRPLQGIQTRVSSLETSFEIRSTIRDLQLRPLAYQRAVLLMCLGEPVRARMVAVQIDHLALSSQEIQFDLATVTEAQRDFKFFARDLDQKASETLDVFDERIRSKSHVCNFGARNKPLFCQPPPSPLQSLSQWKRR